MSQGAAPVTPMPTPVNPSAMNPAAGTLPPEAQMVVPGGGAINEDAGTWAQVRHALGDTTTDFLNLMGDTPEERQTNLESFTKSLKGINDISAQLGKSTLMQRMGQQRGAELAQSAAPPTSPEIYRPMPPMSPQMISDMLESVGLGAQAIATATRPPRR
jgi:hypothetical protein